MNDIKETSEERKFASPELAAIGNFLGESLPFNELPSDQLMAVLGDIVIHYHRQGTVFNNQDDDGGLRIVRSGAIDIRDEDNKLLDRLGEGESFNIHGLNIEEGGVLATVIEDALIYRLPDQAYQVLRQSNRRFDRYFCGQRSRRLRRAARYQPAPNIMMQEVSSVMSRALLSVAAKDSIQNVAKKMTEHRVSSAFIIEDEELVGIVTDRDLRIRYASKTLSPQTPIDEIMTSNPATIDASKSLFETTLFMTQQGFHHLPIIENGELAGVVTTSDLILAKQDDPVYLVQHISRQHDVKGLSELVSGMPNLMVQWVNSGVLAQQVSRILTAISDAITVRLVQLAQEKLGPAPCTWCWVGFGSQARSEQLLGADQDNGIIIGRELAPSEEQWFSDLALLFATV